MSPSRVLELFLSSFLSRVIVLGWWCFVSTFSHRLVGVLLEFVAVVCNILFIYLFLMFLVVYFFPYLFVCML